MKLSVHPSEGERLNSEAQREKSNSCWSCTEKRKEGRLRKGRYMTVSACGSFKAAPVSAGWPQPCQEDPLTYPFRICSHFTGPMPWNWRSCWKAKPAISHISCRQAARISGAHVAAAPCDIWSALKHPRVSAHPASSPSHEHTQRLTHSPRGARSFAINTKTEQELVGHQNSSGGLGCVCVCLAAASSMDTLKLRFMCQ